MRDFKTGLAGLLWVAVAQLPPMAALEPVVALGACDDGSAHLAMGCASISL